MNSTVTDNIPAENLANIAQDAPNPTHIVSDPTRRPMPAKGQPTTPLTAKSSSSVENTPATYKSSKAATIAKEEAPNTQVKPTNRILTRTVPSPFAAGQVQSSGGRTTTAKSKGSLKRGAASAEEEASIGREGESVRKMTGKKRKRNNKEHGQTTLSSWLSIKER